MSTARIWSIATLAFGLAALAVLLAFNLLPDVADAYPYGTFGPALSAFQRAASMDDLAGIFGASPDPRTMAAMTAGNRLDLYGFIPAYTLFLVSAAVMLAGDLRKPLARLAILAVIVAAIADGLETAAQLGVTTEWARAEHYLPFVAPAAWTKYFALAAHALICAAMCFQAPRVFWIVGVLGVLPILGVLAAALDLVRIPSLMTNAFGAFWIALIVLAAMKTIRQPA